MTAVVPRPVGGRLGDPELLRNPIRFSMQAWREHGDVVRYVLGPPGLDREVWVIGHPEAAHQVFASSSAASFDKTGRIYSEIRHWLGAGLLTATGEEWKRQKRFVQPTFTRRTVDGYVTAMRTETAAVLDGWPAPGEEAELDLGRDMMVIALRVAVRALFGDSADRLMAGLAVAFPDLSDTILARTSAVVRLPRSVPTPGVLRGRRAQRALYAVCDELVAARRAGRTQGTDDLLGRLLAARDEGESLTDSEIRDQLLIFLLAGHETTGTALTFALHLIGRRPDLQQAIAAEAAGLGGTPTADGLSALPVTQAVIAETLRLYPSAPFIDRVATRDVDVLGYRVPAGATVLISPFLVHRHPDFWPEAETFDHTRFLPDPDGKRPQRHRYAWMPFGGGPRACIGQHFSLLESAVVLTGVFARYGLTSALDTDQVPVTSAITLSPLEPLTATVRGLAAPSGQADARRP